MNSFNITFPLVLHEVASLIGRLRNNVNVRYQGYGARRPPDETEKGNTLGVLGELVSRLIIEEWFGSDYEVAALLADRPQPGPDIIHQDKRFDVKTIRHNKPDLLVNVESHEKEKGITHYLFIQIMAEENAKGARYWFYSYDEVSEWPTKNVGDLAHYKRIEE